MKTRKKTVEVEEQYWELTRPDLQELRNAMRGGNADKDNIQLLNYAADLIPDKHHEIKRALKERASILQNGISSIDGLLCQS